MVLRLALDQQVAQAAAAVVMILLALQVQQIKVLLAAVEKTTEGLAELAVVAVGQAQ
jgi:hypothetical protein